MTTTKGITKKETQLITFDDETVDLIKKTIATDATDTELKLFLYQAKRTGLDPLARQIYFMKRRVQKNGVWESKVNIQTSIDGFRIVASRQGDYAGQDEAEFVENTQLAGQPPLIAKVRVYKWKKDQRYLAATGVAYWSEYCPQPGQDFMWKRMPHTMLSKVAEALALRKAFPQDLSGLYTDEEMEQAAPVVTTTTTTAPKTPVTPTQTSDNNVPMASPQQVKTVFMLADKLGLDADKTKEVVKKYFTLGSFTELTRTQATQVIEDLMKKIKAKNGVGVDVKPQEPTPATPTVQQVEEGEILTPEDMEEIDKGMADAEAKKPSVDPTDDWINPKTGKTFAEDAAEVSS